MTGHRKPRLIPSIPDCHIGIEMIVSKNSRFLSVLKKLVLVYSLFGDPIVEFSALQSVALQGERLEAFLE